MSISSRPIRRADYAAMLTALATTMTNSVVAASGDFAYPCFTAGGLYTNTAGAWDIAWEAIAAADLVGVNASLGSAAWNSLQCLFALQNGTTGQLPGAFGVSENYTTIAQPPMHAVAALYLHSKSPNLSVLTTLYPKFKLWYGWWTSVRDDASGLSSFGTTSTGLSAATTLIDAGQESGQDIAHVCCDPLYATKMTLGSGVCVTDLCPPDLNAMLVLEANAIASIATILGNSADATTYTAAATARAAAINKYLWDDDANIGGCYHAVSRSDSPNTYTLGTLNSTLASGSTSASVNVTYTGLAISPGARLVFGSTGVTAQAVGITPLGSGVQTVNLIVGASAGVASGTTITVRPMQRKQTLLSLTAPLWAKVASSAQATRIVGEHVMRTYTGREQVAFTAYPGTSYPNGMQQDVGHVEWQSILVGGSTSGDVNRYDATAGTGVAQRLIYRNQTRQTYRQQINGGVQTFVDRPYFMLNAADEQVTPDRNLLVRIMGTWGAAVVINLYDCNGVSIATGSTSSSATLGTATVTFSTSTTTVGKVEIVTPASSNMTIYYSSVITQPIGWVYLSPSGLIAQPRFSANFVAIPPSTEASYGSAGLQSYWSGDIWTPLNYASILGLLNYGFNDYAGQVALNHLQAVKAEYERSGQFSERMSPLGRNAGSPNLPWCGNCASILALTQDLSFSPLSAAA